MITTFIFDDHEWTVDVEGDAFVILKIVWDVDGTPTSFAEVKECSEIREVDYERELINAIRRSASRGNSTLH